MFLQGDGGKVGERITRSRGKINKKEEKGKQGSWTSRHRHYPAPRAVHDFRRACLVCFVCHIQASCRRLVGVNLDIIYAWDRTLAASGGAGVGCLVFAIAP